VKLKERKKMSLDSRSLNVLEDKFFELMSKEGMSEEEAEIEVWKWWEERE
tara:strand:+ start:22 stop:171 length:150 start_codon:yes stop_codon:yes gene_type:complete